MGYTVLVDPDCPVSKSEIIKTVEGAFVRSRIDPDPNVSMVVDENDVREPVLFLGVVLNCLASDEGRNQVFALKINFSKWINSDWARFRG